jgi:TatD DNase family protein
MLVDIHSHHKNIQPNQLKVLTLDPAPGASYEGKLISGSGVLWSAGVHPWSAPMWTAEALQGLSALFRQKEIVAVGEIGLDKGCGVSFEDQMLLFQRQLSFANQFEKPVILHIVGATQELLAIRKRYPKVPAWILHGFRLKPEVLAAYVKNDFYVSFGAQLNLASMKHCPLDRLFLETDDGKWSLQEVYALASRILGLEMKELEDHIEHNFQNIFPNVI